MTLIGQWSHVSWCLVVCPRSTGPEPNRAQGPTGWMPRGSTRLVLPNRLVTDESKTLRHAQVNSNPALFSGPPVQDSGPRHSGPAPDRPRPGETGQPGFCGSGPEAPGPSSLKIGKSPQTQASRATRSFLDRSRVRRPGSSHRVGDGWCVREIGAFERGS